MVSKLYFSTSTEPQIIIFSSLHTCLQILFGGFKCKSACVEVVSTILLI